MTIFVAEMDG